jgi:hypothetical protein
MPEGMPQRREIKTADEELQVGAAVETLEAQERARNILISITKSMREGFSNGTVEESDLTKYLDRLGEVERKIDETKQRTTLH